MKTGYDIIIFALAVLALAGCRQTPVEEPEGDYISFGPTAVNASDASTRDGAGSTLIDSAAELQEHPFGIYGYKSTDDVTFENVFSSYAAQEVYYTTSALSKTDSKGNAYTVDANTWTYDDRQKWDMGKYYRFRAYWPKDKADINTSSTAKFLAITYKQVEDYDLMVAYTTRYPLTEGVDRVPMKFQHALAGLRFKFRYKKVESLKNVSDKATSLYVTGLNLTATLIYGKANENDDVTTLRWNIGDNIFDSTTHLFSWTGSETFSVGDDIDNPTVATVFDKNDHVVFAIPQKLNAKGSSNVSYIHFTTDSGGTAVQQVKFPEDTVLEPGKIYTFTLVISDSSVKVNVDIEDWTEIQSNVDIYF